MKLDMNTMGLRRWVPLLGWPGMLAFGMLALMMSFYLFSMRPMQMRLNDLRHTQSAHAIIKTNVTHDELRTPSEQLEVFYRFFPKEKQVPEWLGKLSALAEKNGLALNDGQYKMTPEQAGRLSRLAITLPVEGQYPQIRKFLAALNHDLPVIALENVQFERKQIAEATVRAKIRLVLFLVSEP